MVSLERKNWQKVTSAECPKTFEGDLGGEYPYYLYLSPERDYILVSSSLETLLNKEEVKRNLEVSPEGVSFFLQWGVIPPPQTIFKNLFVLNIGDKVLIEAFNHKIQLEFFHQYPFFNSLRAKEGQPDEKYILQKLAETVETRKISGSSTYLFQSLGKDSNTILLALAEAGYQKEVLPVTLSTGDRKDESEIAQRLAKKLGFPHQKLPLPKKVEKKHIEEIFYLLENIPLPCEDGASLVYPIYATLIDFRNSNIIDGSGNDIYFGHIPRPIEYKRQKVYPRFYPLRPFLERFSTDFIFYQLGLTRCEIALSFLRGLTYGDSRKIFPESFPTYLYWKEEEEKRKGWDYIDLKGDIWGTKVEYDLVMKKVRNFASIYQANPIFPWANSELALYIGRLPEKYLFDRKTFKNKLLLRKILKEKLDLDSDKLGKFSYGFNAYTFLLSIAPLVEEEVINCTLWDKRNIKSFWEKVKEKAPKKKLFRKIYVRLFLISAWYNHNRYLN